MIEGVLQYKSTESTELIKEKNNILPFPKNYTETETEQDSSYSSNDKEYNITSTIDISRYPSNKSKKAVSIIRTDFTKRIFISLKWLSENHESNIDSIPYT
jgi:hypothetical protein